MSYEQSEWFKMAPYLYTTLTSAPLLAYKRIHSVRFLREQKHEKSFKFQNFDFVMAATTTAGNGALSYNKLDVPLLTTLHDDRLKPFVEKQTELLLENPINCFEQLVTNSNKSVDSTFLAVNEEQKSIVDLYSLNSMLSKEKSEGIKPRQQLEGEKNVSVMRSRREDLLIGREDGTIELFNLARAQKAALKFLYHRAPVSDICWLSTNQRVEQNFFVSVSPEVNCFYLWDKRKEHPAMKIDHNQHTVNCFLFLRNNSFLSGGDPNIKYWDLRNTNCDSFRLEGQSQTVTKLCKIQANDPRTEKFMFASGGNRGQVLIWQDCIDFYHGAHTSKIEELNYSKECDFFVSIEEEVSAMNVWKPYTLSHMLK